MDYEGSAPGSLWVVTPAAGPWTAAAGSRAAAMPMLPMCPVMFVVEAATSSLNMPPVRPVPAGRAPAAAAGGGPVQKMLVKHNTT